MNENEFRIFSGLFERAVEKCFGHSFSSALTETESKRFSDVILEATGLVVGWKTLKNYSIACLRGDAGSENPSTASLDSLARYVMNAPITTEPERKKASSPYEHWFRYKGAQAGAHANSDQTNTGTGESQYRGTPDNGKPQTARINQKRSQKRRIIRWVSATIFIILLTVVFITIKQANKKNFTDDFSDTKQLEMRGWSIINPDIQFWNNRSINAGVLTLYTLFGDNWPDSLHPQPAIRNMLIREIKPGSYTVSMDLRKFLPLHRWEQAGMILLEDTSFHSKSLRISIAFNDNFGGYTRSPEILIQAIKSDLANSLKPEEIVHHPLFVLDSISSRPAILSNFDYTSLQIRGKDGKMELLYAAGSESNSAYHQVATTTIDFVPKYIGIFAIKGLVSNKTITPVFIDGFRLAYDK